MNSMFRSFAIVCILIELIYGNIEYKDAIFGIPFEISFSDTNEFDFTMNHLNNFYIVSSSFFNVTTSNITVAFVRDDPINDYIDIGFAISADTFLHENIIRNTDIDLYRAHIITETVNFPSIIGAESKYTDCSNAKYSTFYHWDIECIYLCDYMLIYNNITNKCEPIPDETSIEIYESLNKSKFIFIGYIVSITFTLITFAFIFLFHQNSILGLNKNTSNIQMTSNTKKRKRSVYFYNDTEDETNVKDDDKAKIKTKTEEVSLSPMDVFPKSNKEIKTENVALSVASTRSNSIILSKSPLKSPTILKEEIFAETSLGSLENIKCENETLQKTKLMIIEEARLKQFKIIDKLDEFRTNIEQEEHKEIVKLKQKFDTNKKNILMLNEEKDKTEQELNKIEKEYNISKGQLIQIHLQNKKEKIKLYKTKIKQQLLDIKGEAGGKILNLLQQNTSDDLHTDEGYSQIQRLVPLMSPL